MKIALVHDYLKEIGGAERVLLTLKEMYPDADVYTGLAFPKYWGHFRNILESWHIKQSWGRWLPFLPKLLSHYTIFSPWFFSAIDLSKYDLVIVSQTGGYFPNGVKVGAKTKLITYCHTPPRFLYGYPTATNERYKWYWRPISEVANHILRMVDFKTAQKPDLFIANSRNVANRIRKFYRREAVVVYPPIDRIQEIGYREKSKEDYFVIVSRILGSKNIELAVEAANKYGFNLKVAGRPVNKNGEEIAKGIKGKTVEYLGEVSDEQKAELLSRAKGFLALERESDFGMTTVEPQMYGTPVVAFRGGGYIETVEDGKTGILFEELTVDGLATAIKRFEKHKWDDKIIKKNAQRFSRKNFEERIKKVILSMENEKVV